MVILEFDFHSLTSGIGKQVHDLLRHLRSPVGEEQN